MKSEEIKFKDGTSKLLEVFKQALNVLIARDQQGLWYLVSRHHIKEDSKYAIKKKESEEESQDVNE